MIYNIGIVAFVVFVNYYGTINPNSKLVEKISLNSVKRIVLIQIGNAFWLILSKYKFLPHHIFEQYLGKDKDTILQ